MLADAQASPQSSAPRPNMSGPGVQGPGGPQPPHGGHGGSYPPRMPGPGQHNMYQGGSGPMQNLQVNISKLIN